MPIRYTEE